MAYLIKHMSRGYYVSAIGKIGVRKRIYIGNLHKSQVEPLTRYVTDLERSVRVNLLPAPTTVDWLNNIDKTLRGKLVAAGLVHADLVKTGTARIWTFDEWLTHCIDSNPGKGSTRKNKTTAKNHLVDLIGDKPISEITPGDCRRCVEQLNANHASTHANKIAAIGKQFLSHAVQDKLIEANPFDGLKFAPKKIDKSRMRYIPRNRMTKIVSKARHNQAKLIFVLARYCGLRVPHEAMAIEWNHVDWQTMQLTVPHDTKTGYRIVPIFPEVASILRDAYELALPGATHIMHQARGSAHTTWTAWLTEALTKAGHPKVPKPWVNLRGSCRTDLEERFPAHVCDAWLGHSSRVAKEHYLSVTQAHWDQAIKGRITPRITRRR